MFRKYEEMMGMLQRYSQSVYEEWARGPGQDCHFSLEQPLLRRDLDSGLLHVNFSREVGAGTGSTCPPLWGDPGAAVGLLTAPPGCAAPQLSAVLREVKYLHIQQQPDIPSNAESLYAQNETFQKIGDNLALIVGWYNQAGSEGGTAQLLFQAERDWGVWVPQAHHWHLGSLPILG